LLTVRITYIVKDCGRQTYFSVNVGDLLDRTSFTRLAMFSSDNTAICTLTQLFDKEIFRVDDERRVDRCERVTLHHGLRLEMTWRMERKRVEAV
jgi:hypothetical protein